MKTACPHCGQHYEVGAEKLGGEADCTSCGRRFVLRALAEPAGVHCPYCCGEILPGAKKCRHCGEWLDAEARPRSQVIYCLLGVFGGFAGFHNLYAKEIVGRASIKWVILFFGVILGRAYHSGWVVLWALFLNEIISLFDIAGCHNRVGVTQDQKR